MKTKTEKLLKWQLDLCESGHAAYHKGQVVDIRNHVNAEPISNLDFMIEKLKEKLC